MISIMYQIFIVHKDTESGNVQTESSWKFEQCEVLFH